MNERDAVLVSTILLEIGLDFKLKAFEEPGSRYVPGLIYAHETLIRRAIQIQKDAGVTMLKDF